MTGVRLHQLEAVADHRRLATRGGARASEASEGEKPRIHAHVRGRQQELSAAQLVVVPAVRLPARRPIGQPPQVLLDPKRGPEDPPADDVHQELPTARPALDRDAIRLDAELGGHLVSVEQLAALLELRRVPEREVAVHALGRLAVGVVHALA